MAGVLLLSFRSGASAWGLSVVTPTAAGSSSAMLRARSTSTAVGGAYDGYRHCSAFASAAGANAGASGTAGGPSLLHKV